MRSQGERIFQSGLKRRGAEKPIDQFDRARKKRLPTAERDRRDALGETTGSAILDGGAAGASTGPVDLRPSGSADASGSGPPVIPSTFVADQTNKNETKGKRTCR